MKAARGNARRLSTPAATNNFAMQATLRASTQATIVATSSSSAAQDLTARSKRGFSTSARFSERPQAVLDPIGLCQAITHDLTIHKCIDSRQHPTYVPYGSVWT